MQREPLTTFNLIMVLILIIFTSFFVASEFAIVKIRRTRIEYLIDQGNKQAIAVKKVLDNLDGYLSACQLGITVTALGIGWLGEPAVAHILEPLLGGLVWSHVVATTVSTAVAFFIITFLHVVLGELVPKTFAIQKAESIALLFSRPLIAFNYVMYPFIWLLNGSANLFSKLFGISPASDSEVAHSEEELRLILSESYESGEINQSEYRYVNKIFEFDDRMAKEIMVPRTEMISLYKNFSLKENLDIMKSEKFTRYPVAAGDKDHIVGIINIKELFSTDLSSENSMDRFIRPIITVIETTPIKQLLVKMQKEQIHMAVLMDEYGGTAGLVTVEDILEEIVGEIRDEFDTDEKPMIEKVNEYKTILDGKVLISDVNYMFGLDIDDSELDTIGGWMLTELPDLHVGSSAEYEIFLFKVSEMDGHQVKAIEVHKLENRESSNNNGETERLSSE